mgnify:CR=1 FL=1
MNKQDIEKKSIKLLQEYFDHKKESLTTPVHTIDVLEYLGYDIDFRSDGIYKNKDILGGVIPLEKKVELNESLTKNKGRLNFTIAHEIGHIILHVNNKVNALFFRTDNSCKEEEIINDKKRKLIENEADQFAAYLLMPSVVIKESFFKLYNKPVNVAKFSFIDFLLRKSKLQKAFLITRKILKIGNFSNVSKTAILNRLIGLRLIRGIPYQTYKIKRR